jgi:hypothetical protein
MSCACCACSGGGLRQFTDENWAPHASGASASSAAADDERAQIVRHHVNATWLQRLFHLRLADWPPMCPLLTVLCAHLSPPRAPLGQSEFAGRFLQMSRDAIVLAVAGVADQSGLFNVVADAPAPITAAEIAILGSLHPRYVEEICACLACADILDFDKATEAFSLTPAKARCLTDASFPLGVGGWLEMLPALYRAVPEVTAATLSPEETLGVPMSKVSLALRTPRFFFFKCLSFTKTGLGQTQGKLNHEGVSFHTRDSTRSGASRAGWTASTRRASSLATSASGCPPHPMPWPSSRRAA